MMKWWPFLVAAGIYLVLTFVRPFSDHHFRYNLEPYPDGFFYTLPALELAAGRPPAVTYQGQVAIKPKVAPLYVAALAVGFLVRHQVTMFYPVNVGLGLLALLGLYVLTKRLHFSPLASLLTALVYLGHLHLIWLPAVPMAENLGLALFIWSLVAVHYQQPRARTSSLAAILIGSLVLIKYTLIGPAAVLAGWLLYRLWQDHQPRLLLLTIAWWVGLAGVFVAYQIMISFNPLGVVSFLTHSSTVSALPAFYSFAYISRNASLYLQGILGWPIQFLWLYFPLSNMLVVGLAVLGLVRASHTKPYSQHRLSFWLAALAGSIFPLLLIFYVVDGRYTIYLIPLLALALGLLVHTSPRQWLPLALVAVALASLSWQQRQLARQIVAANWLGRSRAWQYEAIKTWNEQLSNSKQPTYVITALPPFLATAYGSDRYRLLPLSSAQEFADKGQPVWGNLQYHHLTDEYAQLLQSGATVFVSNAYLTANHQFSQDFAELKQRFTLEPAQTGCLDSCNLYRLRLPTQPAVTAY